MEYLIITAICYTICTISDKHTVTNYNISGKNFTFLMAISTVVFLTPALFFAEIKFTMSIESILCILLVTGNKALEFTTSAIVLNKLSGFETKAWLGISVILSYLTDILLGSELFSVLKLLSIFTLIFGLYLIAKGTSKQQKDKYKGIIIPLILYILSKYLYGFFIRIGSGKISSTLCIYTSMIILTVIYFFILKSKKEISKPDKGTHIVFITRIPNVIGLLSENALIGISLTLYSFAQPLILVILFFIAFFKKESHDKKSFIGSVICTIAVICFKALG